jgi:nitrate/TMAO reductase-like tetraheme cytochrome c subunit
VDLRRRIVVIAAVGLVLLAVVTLWGFRETSKPSFCSSCHFIQPYADSWKTSTHAGYAVTCVNCHFEPGVVGYVKGKIYSIIKITQFAAGQTEKKPEAAKLVILSACLQCHDYIRNPADPRYPKGIVVQGITFPHDFHLNRANLSCADCHSGIAHGGRLVGAAKPQAKADPAFCNSCHTGDIAPILFGSIAPAGREHPGAPKIDVNVWRNSHWKLANAAATIDGVQYDKIEPATCNACHDDPTRAKACKSCHFARVPLFSASPQAERASLLPAFMFVFLFAMFVLTVFMRRHEKERLFNSWIMKVVATVVLISDVYVVYRIISDVVQRQTGQHEIGPTTVWVSYLFLSVGLIAFILFEGVLMPRPLHPAHLPKQDEDRFLTPRPIRRLVKKSGADKGAPPAAPSVTLATPSAVPTEPAEVSESTTASDGASSPEA